MGLALNHCSESFKFEQQNLYDYLRACLYVCLYACLSLCLSVCLSQTMVAVWVMEWQFYVCSALSQLFVKAYTYISCKKSSLGHSTLSVRSH